MPLGGNDVGVEEVEALRVDCEGAIWEGKGGGGLEVVPDVFTKEGAVVIMESLLGRR